MNKLGRLWDWLAPGLIYLDPMGAMAFYQTIDERSYPRPPVQTHFAGALSVLVQIEQIQAPKPLRVGP